MERQYFRDELLKLARLYLAPNYAPFNVMIERADGCRLWDYNGREYLDFLSAYSALNMGHNHPRIRKVLSEQSHKVSVLPGGAVHSPEKILFGKELAEFCGMEMVLLMNTGVEAVETAIKFARKYAYLRKPKKTGITFSDVEIIVCANNFHGRSTTVISFSTEKLYRDHFGPYTPGFKIVPYGAVEAFREAVNLRTAAFLVEPIQGEGGIVVPPDGYLKECWQICQDKGVLFIADEIQSGFGRTGRTFACEHDGVKPDMYIVGKSLSGGYYPISAVASSREILGVSQAGDHGSTFGGGPLACHVAREALRVIKEEKLAERAAELGPYFMDALRAMNSPYVEEVRGRGLWVGVVIKKDGPTAHEFCERLAEGGLICKETRERVIRFSPPLIITKEELDLGLGMIKKVLT